MIHCDYLTPNLQIILLTKAQAKLPGIIATTASGRRYSERPAALSYVIWL